MRMSKDEFVERFTADTKRKAEKPKMNWTAELVHDLYSLKEEGLSNKEIAERLGVDAAAVGKKIANDKFRSKNACSAAKPAENVTKTAESVTKTAENEAVPVKRDTVDSMYILQLEQLLAERTRKCETLEGENQVLQKKLAEQQSSGLDAEKSKELCDALGEVTVYLDCLTAIQLDKLTCSESFNALAELGLAAMRKCGKIVLDIEKSSQTAEAEVGNLEKSSFTV